MEDKIIFVLGSGKCGTTSLTHLLNCSPDIDARHEAYPTLWEYNREVFETDCSFAYNRIYLDSRENLIYEISNSEKVFAEVNHRSSVFLPCWKEMFPNAKYIVLWRDFDETVVSMCKWGCYGEKDTGIDYRLESPFDDYRKSNAWYWVTIYEYILKHLPEDAIGFPLEWMNGNCAEKIQGVFAELDVGIPEISSIKKSVASRLNQAKTHRKIEKNWHEFDDRAREITSRLRGYEKC